MCVRVWVRVGVQYAHTYSSGFIAPGPVCVCVHIYYTIYIYIYAMLLHSMANGRTLVRCDRRVHCTRAAAPIYKFPNVTSGQRGSWPRAAKYIINPCPVCCGDLLCRKKLNEMLSE